MPEKMSAQFAAKTFGKLPYWRDEGNYKVIRKVSSTEDLYLLSRNVKPVAARRQGRAAAFLQFFPLSCARVLLLKFHRAAVS